MEMKSDTTSYIKTRRRSFYPLSYQAEPLSKNVSLINMPDTEKELIKKVEIKMKSQIFKDFTARHFYGSFYVAFHYPAQFLTSSIRSSIIRYNVDELMAKSDNSGELIKVWFDIDNVEVLRRRNKRTEPCNTLWKEGHDDVFKKNLMGHVGCEPPHWKTDEMKLRDCSKPQELSRFDNKFHDKIPMSELFMKPCSTIEKISFRSDITRRSRYLTSNPSVTIQIEFQDSVFKEIEYLQGRLF